MHKLYELKEMLCEELEEYGSKDKLDVGGLEIVDKLAHAVKNLDKIIEAYEDEQYSMDGGSYTDGGGSYEGGRQNGGGMSNRYSRRMSYARGRGRNARRDSMGRYSRAGQDMVMELRELMEDAPDERTRQEFQKIISRMEQQM